VDADARTSGSPPLDPWVFFDHAAEGMVVTRIDDGVIVAANDAWLALTGLDRSEAIGHPWSELDVTRVPEPPRSITAGLERSARREVELRSRSGEHRVVDERSRVMEIDGEPFVLCTTIDLTEERQLLVDLERSRSDLAKAQAITRTGSYVFDLRTDEVLPSDELLRLFSIRPSDFGGKLEDVLSRLHPDDVPLIGRSIATILRERVVPSVRVRTLGPEDEIRWLEAQGELEVDPDGTPIRVVGTAQDVTEQALLEQEAHRLQARLVELREADRREIAEEIQDGLLQTLSALLLRLEIIGGRLDEDDADDLARVTEAVRGSMQRARRVVFDLHPTALDHGIGAAVEDLAVRMQPAWALEVQVEDLTEDRVPPEVRSTVYRFVREVLGALAPGTAAVRITVERDLVAEVRHHGVGRLDDADRPVLEEVAELAGGSLEVETNDETTVRLRLPDPSSLSV
jgi:PAS domain S-box-containing protein